MKTNLLQKTKTAQRKAVLLVLSFVPLTVPGLWAQETQNPKIQERLRRLEERMDELEDKESGLSWGGYGEMKYRNYQSPYKKDQADVARIVLLAEYDFTDWISFHTEIEYEHAGFERESIAGSSFNSSEVFIENATLNLEFAKEAQLALGLHLLPIGYTNAKHEPTVFLAVERPRSDTDIIPSTWREVGAILHGQVGDRLKYKTGIVNGPRSTDFGESSWIRGGRTKGSKARAEGMAGFVRLDFLATDGLTLGASYYQGESAQGEITAVDWKTRLTDPLDAASDGTGLKTALQEIRDNKNKRGKVRVHIAEAHLRLNKGPWMGLAQFVQGWMNEADTRNVNSATGKNIGQRVEGAYGELGYNVLSHFRTTQKLYPFVRYEYVNTQKETVRRYYGGREDQMDAVCAALNNTCKTTSALPNGNRDLGVVSASDPAKELYGVQGVADRTNDRRYLTLGLAWFPDPAVVLKLEYERLDSKSNWHSDIESRNSGNNKIDRIQFGAGFAF